MSTYSKNSPPTRVVSRRRGSRDSVSKHLPMRERQERAPARPFGPADERRRPLDDEPLVDDGCSFEVREIQGQERSDFRAFPPQPRGRTADKRLGEVADSRDRQSIRWDVIGRAPCRAAIIGRRSRKQRHSGPNRSVLSRSVLKSLGGRSRRPISADRARPVGRQRRRTHTTHVTPAGGDRRPHTWRIPPARSDPTARRRPTALAVAAEGGDQIPLGVSGTDCDRPLFYPPPQKVSTNRFAGDTAAP